MKTKQIGNPGGAWTAGATWSPASADSDSRLVCMMVNNSGASLAVGDLVVFQTTSGVNATTTTSASDKKVIGVVGEPPDGDGAVGATATSGFTYAAGSLVPVIVYGHARINIGANTVAALDNLASTTAAKVAGTPTAAGSVGALQALIGSFIAIAQEADSAKGADNTIRCWVNKC